MNKYLLSVAANHLDNLVHVKPNRRLGSKGNNQAVKYCTDLLASYNFQIDSSGFECLDYESSNLEFFNQNRVFDLSVSPYSLPCNIETKIIVIKNIEELKNTCVEGKILLLKDEICTEQLMPKNFTFYNPDHHKNIIKLLEEKNPAAIIAATKKNAEVAAALDPFPLLEDGDFDIPILYCNTNTGSSIELESDKIFHLSFNSQRIPVRSSNVIGHRNINFDKKITITSHIDAYGCSPGAIDNAGGVVVLLLLAEMLQNYDGMYCLELIAFNGEDHYSAAGEMDYLKRYGDKLNTIKLSINVDDAAFYEGKTALSFYNINDVSKSSLIKNFDPDEFIEGPIWYQGDHMLFVASEIPAIAVTSEKLDIVMKEYAHTEKDLPQIVDCSKLLKIAENINKLIRTL